MARDPFMAELEAYATDPENWDSLCTYGVIRVWRRFGGEMFGYWCSQNPSAIAGKSESGHDFCIVGQRYLVDAWASLVEGLPVPVVIDMTTKAGQKMIQAWYGDRQCWMKTRDAAGKRQFANIGA